LLAARVVERRRAVRGGRAMRGRGMRGRWMGPRWMDRREIHGSGVRRRLNDGGRRRERLRRLGASRRRWRVRRRAARSQRPQQQHDERRQTGRRHFDPSALPKIRRATGRRVAWHGPRDRYDAVCRACALPCRHPRGYRRMARGRCSPSRKIEPSMLRTFAGSGRRPDPGRGPRRAAGPKVPVCPGLMRQQEPEFACVRSWLRRCPGCRTKPATCEATPERH